MRAHFILPLGTKRQYLLIPSKPQDGQCSRPSAGQSRPCRPACRRLFPGRRRRHALLLSLRERGIVVLDGRRLSSCDCDPFFFIGRSSGWFNGSSGLASRRKPGRRSAARLPHPLSPPGPIVGGVRADRPPLRGEPRASDLASRPSAPLHGEPSTRRPSTLGRCQAPPWQCFSTSVASSGRHTSMATASQRPADWPGDETSHGAVGGLWQKVPGGTACAGARAGAPSRHQRPAPSPPRVSRRPPVALCPLAA